MLALKGFPQGVGAPPPRSSRTAIAVVALAATVFSLFILRFGGSTAGGADTSGYLASARLLLQGEVSEPARAVPALPSGGLTTWERAPLGYRPVPGENRIAPVYPVGFPLHIAAAATITGIDSAVVLVNLLAWIGLVLVLCRLGRELELPDGWTAAAVVLFGLYPVTVLHYSRVMSDGLATTWSAATVLFALKAHRHLRHAMLAGVALGVAVLVRPTSLLLIPAVLVAERWRWRSLAATVAVGAPLALALGCYNWATYRTVLTTGYGDVSREFALANVLPCLVHFGSWLSRQLSPAFLALVAAGAVAAVLGDRRQRLLLTWGGAIVAFYLFYAPSLQGWWRLRFILPAMPALLLSSLLVARDLSTEVRRRARDRRGPRLLVIVVLVGALLWAAASSTRAIVNDRLWSKGRGETDYRNAARWLERQVEGDAVVLCKQASGALMFYGRLPIIRYDRLSDQTAQALLQRAGRGELHLYALLFNVDVGPFEARFGNKWRQVGQLGQARLRRPPARQPPPPPSL